LTRALLTNNAIDAYDRPTDWRWRRAGELIRIERGLRRDRDHNRMVDIFRFRKQVEAANTPEKLLFLQNKNADIYTAWSIYQDNADSGRRGEIEARILAQEPYKDIARKMALTSDAVTAYELYFFNVTDRLDAPGYLTHQVFGRSVQTGLAEREYDLLWKMYGYWCGPKVLDMLIYKFNNPSRPETAESVTALWTDDISETVRMNTAIAMRQKPVDWERQIEIGNMFLRMVEIERNAGSGGGIGTEAILENVSAMMERLPWKKYDLGIRSPEEAETEIERIEMRGIGLRSAELAMFGVGCPPPGFQHLMDAAVYPTIEDGKK